MEVTSNYGNYNHVDNAKKASGDNGSILEKLQEKYSGFDVKSGNFSDRQMTKSGSGFQGVMISPAYLAKAENDEAAANKLDEMLSGVEQAQKWLENAFAKDGTKLISSGFYVDENGQMGSYSVVEKKDSPIDSLNKSDENAEKLREKRKKEKAEKKEEEKRAEKEAERLEKAKETVTVAALTPQELVKKAREEVSGTTEKQLAEQEKAVGRNFDYMV